MWVFVLKSKDQAFVKSKEWCTSTKNKRVSKLKYLRIESTLQSIVGLSTTEAEYIAMTEAINEAICLVGLAEELGIKKDVISIGCDNQSAIHLSKQQVFLERSNHIDVKLHFVRDINSHSFT